MKNIENRNERMSKIEAECIPILEKHIKSGITPENMRIRRLPLPNFYIIYDAKYDLKQLAYSWKEPKAGGFHDKVLFLKPTKYHKRIRASSPTTISPEAQTMLHQQQSLTRHIKEKYYKKHKKDTNPISTHRNIRDHINTNTPAASHLIVKKMSTPLLYRVSKRKEYDHTFVIRNGNISILIEYDEYRPI